MSPHRPQITLLMKTLVLALATAGCLLAQISVVTNRYDNLGTGANLHERSLKVASVNVTTFGKLFSYGVNGAVYAQPLYLAAVNIPGRGVHNVVFIATMEDQVYAFDADRSGTALWQKDLTDRAAGITPVPIADITEDNNLNIVGDVGILSTPVIDRDAGIIYLVCRTKEKHGYTQTLHALDVRTGRDRMPAAVIRARIESLANDAIDGYVHFNPKTNNQRPALTLANGQILIAWASHEDIAPYHGWIMAYDAKTLKQTAVLCITPTGSAGGIWQSGRGAVIDREGNIYYETGNGDWNGTTDWGESLLKLRIRDGKFQVLDFFTPADYRALNERDADFGSTGPMLIPGTDLIVCGDKHGLLTLLNTKRLGKLSSNSRPVQSVNVDGGRVLSGPVWWKGPAGSLLYLWGEADSLKAFRFNGSTLNPEFFTKSKIRSHGSPGGALTVSADERKAGTGIIWAMLTLNKSADHGNAPGVLRAFNAETLQELWNSEQNLARDQLGTLVKFVPPTVVNGKVYAPTYDNLVNVYGLLRAGRTADSAVTSQ
jgi:outer membrane protein assembly factor BamB